MGKNNIANPEHLAILNQGVKEWNKWREDGPRVKPDFIKANLSQAKLSKANLVNADMRGADLRNSDLSGANLSNVKLIQANLTGADLRNACLSRANLTQANLCGANLSNAYLWRADLNKTNLSNADLSGANLICASLIDTNFKNAKLTYCRVFGISAWNVNLDRSEQSNLIITRQGEATITADKLEVAQFIYLILNNQSIRDAIDTIATKAVLILGRFTPERKTVLDAIRDELRRRDYLPILFDFDKPSSRNLTETVSTLAHMARFVIADITDAKSIPQELQRIVPSLPSLPVQPLLLSSEYEYGMFKDFLDYPWVLIPYRYDSTEDLLASLEEKVIAPAAAKAKEIEERRKALEREMYR